MKSKACPVRWSLRLVAAATAIGLALGGPALADPPKTLEAGKLKVALNGDMPMTSVKDGKLVGTDGDLVVKMAANLGLEVEPQLMEWSAEIQSTKSCKVDIMHGAMGWTVDRTKIMLITDPIYYFGTLLAQKKATSYSTFADMKGRSVGTVTGFTLVPELQTVEGIGEVKTYDTTDGVLRDLVAGRLDMAILDPPLMELAILNNPDWELHQVELQPEPDKYPIMSTKYNVVIGVCPEQKELHDALNAEIAKAWENCENVKLMAAYGLTAKAWFDPPPEPSARVGVDRPEGWKAPSGAHCFPN
jgi:polar amino acid transport system substrate-binding protein